MALSTAEKRARQRARELARARESAARIDALKAARGADPQQAPDAPILADWDHEDCAICAKAAAEPARGMNVSELLLSVGVGVLLWGLIGYVVVLIMLAVA